MNVSDIFYENKIMSICIVEHFKVIYICGREMKEIVIDSGMFDNDSLPLHSYVYCEYYARLYNLSINS